MKRLCAIGLLCLAMAGCQWPSKPGVDPFLGPTRVDPPATGSIQGPVSGAPYLGPAPSAAGPNVTVPGPAGSYTPSYTPSPAPAYTPASPQTLPGPAPNNSYSPPGGFNYRQGSVDRTKAVSPSPTGAASQGAILANGSRSSVPGEAAGQSSGAAEENAEYVEEQGTGAVRTSHEEAIRLVGPTDSETADGEGLVPTAATQPRRLDPPGDAIDIMDLPKAGTSSAAKTAAKGDSFRVVGTSAGARTQTVSSSSSSSAESRYGRDGGYRWLKGQLEYSEVSRQWKLRYVPIDGQTDQYGGSVVLGDSPLLKDFKQGDFVTVQGTVAGKNAENGGFAPTYRLDQIN